MVAVGPQNAVALTSVVRRDHLEGGFQAFAPVPGRFSGCWPHDGEVAGGAVADLGLLISGAALTLFLTLTRARATGSTTLR
jgi:hypothetical protein